MAKLLCGVRVLDLTNVVSGPLCSYQLAMLGAEVLKIEVPTTGDLSRKMGADPELGRHAMGVGFLAMNAGKKSLALNLKTDTGRKIFEKLAATADVVLENFRPGAMQRLKLGWQHLRDINPRLIYCAVSGFGQSGPLAQRPTYDQIVQGFSGLMSVTGTMETAPNRAGYVVCDTTAAITAAFAICAALYRRTQSGAGEHIDVSMLDCALTSMAVWPIANYLNAGFNPRPVGNDNPTASPSGTFRTGDGLINIVNNEQKQFEALCGALGASELLHDARFARPEMRVKHRTALSEIIEQKLHCKSATDWEAILSEAGVPAGRIYSVPEILDHPQVAHRDILKWFDRAKHVDRKIAITRTGFRLESEQPDVQSAPPALGEHTHEILHELGYSDVEIEDLRADGTI